MCKPAGTGKDAVQLSQNHGGRDTWQNCWDREVTTPENTDQNRQRL